MAQLIDGYTITASNASKKGSQMASVTVRDSAGEILARIYSERSQPLRWLRKWPHCQERHALTEQLRKANVQQNIIDKIVSDCA